MKRILFVANAGEMYGGGQVSFYHLIRDLDRQEFEPFIICPGEGSLVEAFKQIGIHPTIIPMRALRLGQVFSMIKTVQAITCLIKEKRIELIHCNGSRSAIYSGFASFFTHRPLISHIRIPYSDGWVDRLIAFFSKRIVVVSKAVAQRFSWLNNRKVQLIYNGVDLDVLSPQCKESANPQRFFVKKEDQVIGVVGRLSPEKGHDILIQALPRIIKNTPRVRVLLVGEGDAKYKDFLQDRIKNEDLQEVFIFTGHIIKMEEVMGIIDILCLPSISEGFNRSLLEAMACGIPVVATKVGGNSEAVEDQGQGLLVPYGDAEALGDAIIDLLKDQDKAQKMGQAGRKRVEQFFSIQRNVDQTQKLYRSILN